MKVKENVFGKRNEEKIAMKQLRKNSVGEKK